MENSESNDNGSSRGDPDPFDWPIHEVASYLCYGSFHWSRSQNPPRPDPEALDRIIRENDVTGEVLLTDITKEILARDLGIRSLGQRSTIFNAIQYLRTRSVKYKELETQFAPASTCYSQSVPSSATEFPDRQWRPWPATEPIASPTTSPATPGSRLAKPFHTRPEAEPNSVSVRLRSDEHMVTDSGGRKRRKLTLPTRSHSRLSAQPKARRVERQDWYLGRKKLTAPDLFYGSDESDGDVFSITTSPRIPPGKRLFVKRQMQHYLQQPLKPITRDGRKGFALFPYDSHVGLETPQYFTLFAKNNTGTVMATKEDLSNWAELDERAGETLPLYGESESEDGYDPDTLQEILAEEEERQKQQAAGREQNGLSTAELDDIIENCVAKFIETWHTTRKPTGGRKARKLWALSRKKGSRERDIRATTSLVARLERRLTDLREEIKKFSWSKPIEVRQQCHCMEATVFDREYEKWKISILELDKCPSSQSVTKKQQKTGPRRDPSLASDEEDLLDLENSSSEDVDDLIVPDEEHDGDSISAEKLDRQVGGNSGSECETPSREEEMHPRQRRVTAAAVSPEQTHPDANDTKQPSLRRLRKRKDLAASLNVIDLTKSSDDESAKDTAKPSPTASEANEVEVKTPPLNPGSDAAPISSQSTDKPHDELSLAIESWPSSRNSSAQLSNQRNVDDISRISWSYLEEREDRVQLLNKLVRSISDEECESLRSLVGSVKRKNWERGTWKALRALQKSTPDFRFDYSKDNHQLFLRMATFYVSWVGCKKLDDKGIPKWLIDKAANKRELRNFYFKLCAALQVSPKSQKPGETTRGVSSCTTPGESSQVLLHRSDSGSPVEEHLHSNMSTPRKKRKRPVKQSQEAMATQESAQRRVKLQEQQQKRVTRKLEIMGVENDDPSRKAISFDDPVIYLDRHLGGRVKPHQLEGIQFMWRELIKDERHHGCLLAHTMGLGKTMQVISLLVAIADASNSPDPKVRNQVPEDLRQSRTLVLCPSALIDNWWEELSLWTPETSRDNLGMPRKISSTFTTISWRLQEISQWYTEGGILLLSYDLFRKFVSNKATKARDAPLSSEQHKTALEHLLEGPNIIVADEAHKMKNRCTGVAEAARRFKSKSRIALTGSPLANKLNDYFAMIDWISPNYLGDFVQFKEKYVEPIEEGLYADCLPSEKRKSLKRLQVLKKDLEPKVHRRDITVLEGSLPPKVEFVLTVPLTELQTQAYRIYVESVSRKGDIGSMGFLDELRSLSLLCNHPAALLARLIKRYDPRAAQPLSPPESGLEPEPLESASLSQEVSQESTAELKRLLETIEDIQAPHHSHRVQIIEDIIAESIDAGDKILVFSHTLPTLDYIEKRLLVTNRSYCRLDGGTPMGTRQDSTKNFNKPESKTHVYLISTEAGGLGLNIFGANRVILIDFQWNPTCEEQAVGRAYRLGQTKPVFVYRFVSGGTFEEILHNKTVYKTQLFYSVVEKKNPIPLAFKSAREYVFPPKTVPQEDLSEYKGKDTVLDKFLGEKSLIRKIELTETFQREGNEKLSAEEEKDVQAELELERLKRNNPAEFARRERERQIQEQESLARYSSWANHPTAYQASQRTSSYPFPGPSRPQPGQPHSTIQPVGFPQQPAPHSVIPTAVPGPPETPSATRQTFAPAPSDQTTPSSAPPHTSFPVSNGETLPINGRTAQNPAGANE